MVFATTNDRVDRLGPSTGTERNGVFFTDQQHRRDAPIDDRIDAVFGIQEN
jgi:hypothetical protein